MLVKESLKALAGLGLLSLGGKYLLRRVFEVAICFLVKLFIFNFSEAMLNL